MGLEVHALLFDAPQLCQGEYLEAAAIGENGAIPVDEFMQTAHFPDHRVRGPQMQMIGVAELHLAFQFLEIHGGNAALDGTGSAYIHETGCLKGTVYGIHRASPGKSLLL